MLLFIVMILPSCKKRVADSDVDTNRPRPVLNEYFDKKYLLYRLPANYYEKDRPAASFAVGGSKDIISFKPLGYDTSLNLQYTHLYSSKCVYHTADTIWKYAEVCFPNTCLTKDSAYAVAVIRNSSKQTKTYWLRLFYQNTSYWYRADDSINTKYPDYLDNYYGESEVVRVSIEAGKDSAIKIPYTIGLDPKGECYFDPSKFPARPGNYEFLLLALPEQDNQLLNDKLNLQKVNPFAVVKLDQLNNGGKKYFNYCAYVPAHHFKFVFLDEYFNGKNDLTQNHIYIPKNGTEKRLCDTCSGWYRAIIDEYWKSADFFKGYISKGYFVKADYGIKKENCRIDSNGITLTIPKSTRGDYKKTWGEFLFGPSFKYGHLTVRAKFAQMMNKTGLPNGIIHNLWLYQRDPDEIDTTNPYHYLQNGAGKQPYEIDFEIWNSEEGINSMWDDQAFINYSIVDYMRDPDVIIKPGELKNIDRHRVHRLNNRQLNIPGENIPREYFNEYHTYELYWYLTALGS